VAALKIAQDELPDHAPGQRVQTYPVETEEPRGTGVVTDRAIGLECRTGIVPVRPCRPNGLSRLIPGATGQLCPQPVLGAGGAIDDVMELVLVGDALLPRDRGAIGRRRVERRSRCRRFQLRRRATACSIRYVWRASVS
jgi:hypothetical protein